MPDYLALPDEVVAETILWRLPVKSIMQCRYVCKSWNSLITSPNFISTQLRRKTLTTKNPKIFLNQTDHEDDTGGCLLLFDNQDYFRSMSFRLHHNVPNPHIQVIGSVNGLICFTVRQHGVYHNYKLIIFNPLIGRFQSISIPNSLVTSQINCHVKGFGFDERTLDYNILLISPREVGFIYSLNSNSWRKIPIFESIEYRIQFCSPVCFVNGRFHWLAQYNFEDKLIMVFDVKSETFSHISVPKCLENRIDGMLRFLEFGESSLAILHEKPGGGRSIWIMEEYGSVESWLNFKIGPCPYGAVIGFRNKDEVLIKYPGCLSSQKININKLENVKKMANVYEHPVLGDRPHFSVHKYVPSLVLLDKQNNIDVDVVAPTHSIINIAAPASSSETD